MSTDEHGDIGHEFLFYPMLDNIMVVCTCGWRTAMPGGKTLAQYSELREMHAPES